MLRFSDISIDFAAIPPHTGGWDQLMVVVCRLTKFVRLIQCKSIDSTNQIAKRFLTGWYALGFGLPQSITSDRDSKFTSSLWEELSSLLKIKLETSTSRHQQTNGQAEIAVRTFKRTARKFTALLDEDEWELSLSLLEYALNNSVNASTGFTPFFLAYGFQPRSFPEEYDQLLNSFTASTHSLIDLIERNLTLAQDAIASSQTSCRGAETSS